MSEPMFIEVRYTPAAVVKGLSLVREFKLMCCNPRTRKPKANPAPRVPLVQYEFLPPVKPKAEKKEKKQKQTDLC